ncbi:MAG TPA: hypothetical protein VFZ75_05425 [Actinomycetota bacterium]|nr:hypothetical protein [Actinomycetota bacterium]
MSAQGATVRRGTAHLPMWPLAVLVAAAVAVAIGISWIDRPGTTTNVLPTGPEVGISHATPRFDYVPATDFPGPYGVPVAGAGSTGSSNVSPLAEDYVAATDFPGPYGVPVAEVGVGTAGDGAFTPTLGVRPRMTGDTICGQCR